MRFERFKLYSHNRMLDAAIFVQEAMHCTLGRTKLKVLWFNKRGLNLGVSETVLITPAEMGNWYELFTTKT